jgi:O-methyltransferase
MTIPNRYLDLLSLCLTRSMDEPLGRVPRNHTTAWKRLRTAIYEGINAEFNKQGLALVETRMGQRETMVSREALRNIYDCVEAVVVNGTEGDLLEAGVWRGGSAIFMRGCLEVFVELIDVPRRKVWAADSFEGLPKPDPKSYPADDGDEHWKQGLGVGGVETVKQNFAKYGLLDERVQFLVGWFKDTLPAAPIEKLAVLRLDGDMYESTWQVLDAMYEKLSPGGFCIVDDYGCVPGCKKAVDDYREKHGIAEPMQKVDWTVYCWRKGTT